MPSGWRGSSVRRGSAQRARDQYLRALNGMLYGDDPSEGYVRGREFAHVELGIAFTVPEGYVLKNTSQAVLATDGEHTAIRFDAVGLAEQTPLAEYLRSGWIKGLVADSRAASTRSTGSRPRRPRRSWRAGRSASASSASRNACVPLHLRVVEARLAPTRARSAAR